MHVLIEERKESQGPESRMSYIVRDVYRLKRPYTPYVLLHLTELEARRNEEAGAFLCNCEKENMQIAAKTTMSRLLTPL